MYVGYMGTHPTQILFFLMRLLAAHDKRATMRESAVFPVPLSSLSIQRMYSTTVKVYSTTTKLKDPQTITSSHLHASNDMRVTTREIAAYPVPLSSLSTRKMCSTTGRVYSTTTTKLKDPQTVTSPCLLTSHDTRVTMREPAVYPVPLSLRQPRGCAVQPGEYISPPPQSTRTPEKSQVSSACIP